MASFHNFGDVQHQVAHQAIYGDMHLNTYYGETKIDPMERLDNEVLESLSFPEMTDRRRNVNPPHHQTCQWIFQLEEYQSWHARTSGLLWIKGKPGAGKSTLMSHLYSDVFAQPSVLTDVRLEFFFSARGAPLQRSFVGMLRSLSNQIFRSDTEVRSLLRKPYQAQQESFGRANRSYEWQQAELMSLFTDMVLASAERWQVVVFVDALDEAGEQAAEEIARYLHCLNDRALERSMKVKICISCRHYPVPSLFPTVEIHVEDHNRDDIRAYVRDQFNGGILSHNNVGFHTEWESLIHSLVDMAAGVFQWVCLVIPMVTKWVGDGDSPEQFQQYLSQVPTGLKQVYEHIIKHVIDQKLRARSLQLFQWVCLAIHPLSVTEIRHALAACDIVIDPLPQSRCGETRHFVKTDDIMKLKIRSWSGGLIEVVDRDTDPHTTIVQPVHQSVNEFFLAQGFYLLAQPELGQSQRESRLPNAVEREITDVVGICHAQLYRSCLYHLSAEQSVLSQYLRWSSYIAQSEVEARFPFVMYAACNILTHAEKAQSHRSSNLGQEVQLIESTLQPWIGVWAGLYPDLAVLRKGATALHVAAAANLNDLASHLLEHSGHLDARDSYQRTALHIAAWQGHVPMLKTLCEAGANVQAKSRFNLTPLTLAAGRGHTKAFSWLWKQIPGPSREEKRLEKALYFAAERGEIAVVNLCIEAGADLNAQLGDLESGTALAAASYSGEEEVVKLLLDKGADVNAKGGQCGNALQAASLTGKMNIVRLLLDRGADVNVQGGQYGSALEGAWSEDHDDVIDLLLSRGATWPDGEPPDLKPELKSVRQSEPYSEPEHEPMPEPMSEPRPRYSHFGRQFLSTHTYRQKLRL